MKIRLTVFFLISIVHISAQNTFSPLAYLPEVINESSGIETLDGGKTFWTHNDSGDDARIFQIDTNGKLLRTVYLRGVKAIDIEELSSDDKGNLYICDIGNNNNQRKDLCIYIATENDLLKFDTVSVSKITYQYENQTAFPPEKDYRNFDCEGVYFEDGKLNLFSKNRGVSAYSYQYQIPAIAGNYNAKLVDSTLVNSWTCAADISPNKNLICIFSNGEMQVINRSTKKTATLTFDYSQKEAVVFADDSTLYLTEEENFNKKPRLYRIDLNPGVFEQNYTNLSRYFFLKNQDISKRAEVLVLFDSEPFTIKLMNLNNEEIELQKSEENKSEYHFNTENLSPATYYFILEAKDNIFYFYFEKH